ncbi:MAG: acyltransferase [Bacteroidota bacterium]
MQTINKTVTPGYLSSLTLLRAIAVLLVCFFHVLSKELFSEKNIFHFFSNYGYVGLDMFFIISGFVIPYSMYKGGYAYKSFPKYLLKRIIRLEPPYLASILMILFLRFVSARLGGFDYSIDSIDWVQVALHFGYLNQYFGYEPFNVVYWTLAIELQFYLLMGLTFPLIVHKRKIFAWLILFLFGYLGWSLNLHYNWFIFQYGFMFINGIILFLYKTKQINVQCFVAALIVIFFLVWIKNPVEVAGTCIFTSTVILFLNKEWKATNFLGKISYSLYLTHTETAGYFIVWMGETITNIYTLRISALIVAFIIACLFYKFIEQPSLNLSKKIRYSF